MSVPHTGFLQRAIQLAVSNVAAGGGPFGAVIVFRQQVVAEGANRVTLTNDPTAHAEIVAIREACRSLGRFQLEGCAIYCSCEPCPMCLGAIYWARLREVYFAATREDAARAGFDDSLIYNEIPLPPQQRKIMMAQAPCPEAAEPFRTWLARADRILY